MVEVPVAVDDVADRLAGRERLRLLDDGERSRIGERRLDEDEVIGHLDRDAVVRAAGEEPDAGAEPLDDDALRLIARRLGHVEGSGRVHLHGRDGEVEHGVAAHRLAHSHRELHAREVAVLGIRRHRPGVAEHRIGDDRVDLRDEAVGADDQRSR